MFVFFKKMPALKKCICVYVTYRVLKPCTSVLEHAAMMMNMAKAE